MKEVKNSRVDSNIIPLTNNCELRIYAQKKMHFSLQFINTFLDVFFLPLIQYLCV